MKKIRNLFVNLFILIFRIKYVLVSIRDYSISMGSTINNIYPGKDSFLKLEVPLSKLVNFNKNQYIKEFVYVQLEKNAPPILFEVVSVEYIYDLMTGELAEVIIYSNLSKKK